MNHRTLLLSCSLLALSACSPASPPDDTPSGNGTSNALCGYQSSVYNADESVKATSTATWTCSALERFVEANGLPDHAVGTFPNANNPNTIAAQSVNARFPLTPTLTTTATQLGGPAGDVAIMLNGVKADPGAAGSCDDSGSACTVIGNNGQWRIEALGQSSFKFGTDSSNAHVQPAGAYHYHGMPEGLVTRLGKGKALTLVGWAADGYPVYARYGYTVATNPASGIKVVKSSYQLKPSPDANRPATSLFPMGTFQQDYAYVAGSGDLDECNGRSGRTPEFPRGTYHYYATDTYPYLQRCVKGKVTVRPPPPPVGPPPPMGPTGMGTDGPRLTDPAAQGGI